MGLGAVLACTYILSKLLWTESGAALVFGALYWIPLYLGAVHVIVVVTERAR
jgi:hypothetical protein